MTRPLKDLGGVLQDLGPCVPVPPRLALAIGCVKATIFLQQLIYWTPRTREEADRWVYKKSEEIMWETGLKYEAQLTARKRLVRLGIIEEKYKRLEHRLYFRVVFENLNILWDEFLSANENALVKVEAPKWRTAPPEMENSPPPKWRTAIWWKG